MLDRDAKEAKLYDLLLRAAEHQYGAPGSYQLEAFMADVEKQISEMTDEELDQALEDNA